MSRLLRAWCAARHPDGEALAAALAPLPVRPTYEPPASAVGVDRALVGSEFSAVAGDVDRLRLAFTPEPTDAAVAATAAALLPDPRARVARAVDLVRRKAGGMDVLYGVDLGPDGRRGKVYLHRDRRQPARAFAPWVAAIDAAALLDARQVAQDAERIGAPVGFVAVDLHPDGASAVKRYHETSDRADAERALRAVGETDLAAIAAALPPALDEVPYGALITRRFGPSGLLDTTLHVRLAGVPGAPALLDPALWPTVHAMRAEAASLGAGWWPTYASWKTAGAGVSPTVYYQVGRPGWWTDPGDAWDGRDGRTP